MVDIDSQLDSHILNIFDTLEKLFAAQSDLEQMMKDGFFNISRARYSLGMKRVSADQILEADMQAKHTVTLSDAIVKEAEDRTDGVDPKLQRESQDKEPMFTLQSTNIEEPESVQACPKKVDAASLNSSLRKRVIKSADDPVDSDSSQVHNSDANKSKDTKKIDPRDSKMADSLSESKDEGDIEENEKKGKKEGNKQFNPLHLFGVLVPGELRVSQQKFESALALAVQVCNLQKELQEQQNNYQKLKERQASDE